MNENEAHSMTETEIRVAIAEALGWIKFWQPTGEDEGQGHWEWHLGNNNVRLLPDYLHDLNAMHAAEESLSPALKEIYSQTLTEGYNGPGWRFALIHATAAQRAEEFLRTIGKWKE